MSTAVSVITGFLGSGKTTLLRHLLQQDLGGRRVALIVNEIGAVGFDGRAIEGRGERMIELVNGCICCSMGTDFLVAVEELIETVDPDLILIETTGLAEPLGLVRQIRAAGLLLDSVVTVADAAALTTALDLATVARWQLHAADFVVLNKLDLVTPEQLEEARASVRQHNSRAAILETVGGELAWQQLFGLEPAFPAPIPADTPPTDHLSLDGFSTMLWQCDLPLNRKRLEQTLEQLPTTVYRLKGHVHCSDAPWPTLVNFVCGRAGYEDTRFKRAPAHLSELVLIGPFAAPLADLGARLDSCVEHGERTAAWLARHAELW